MSGVMTTFAGLAAFKRNAKSVAGRADSHTRSQSNELTPEQILENMPGHISTLNLQGIWQPVAPGNCDYVKSIKTNNFVHWVNEFVHVQDRVGVLKAVGDCRANSIETFAHFRPLNNSGMSGLPIWVEIRCVPNVDTETILTILRDISDRKCLELQYVEARESADQSNIAKSRFLANMSHELRTPLNAIIGFSDILKSGMITADDTERQTEYQDIINESAHHLLHVLNDILDMSKIEAGKYEIYPEEIDIVSLVHSTCSILKPLADKASVNLNISASEQELFLSADSKAIRQVIINLVSNSIKFADANTEIAVSTRRTGRKIELIIADRGPGISPESLDGLGSPFYQVDNEKSRHHEGSGLGLSIVNGLVDLHGGQLRVESKVGFGTTVVVELPQSIASSAPVPANDKDLVIRIKPQPSLSDGHKILYTNAVG